MFFSAIFILAVNNTENERLCLHDAVKGLCIADKNLTSVYLTAFSANIIL